MVFQLKSSRVLLLLFVGIAFGLIYVTVFQNDGRISWVETTRRKLLLYDSHIPFHKVEKLEQTFVANYPGLSQIDILFDDIARPSTVSFHLKHRCDSTEDIMHISVELTPNREPEFYPFTFPPLDSSAGQKYCIILEPESSVDTSIAVQLSNGDLYPYGELTVHNAETEAENASTPEIEIDDNQQKYKVFLPIIINEYLEEETLVQDIGFRLHYNGLLFPTGQVFFTRLTANKPYIWGQAWFYGMLVIIYLILLVGLFVIAQKTNRINLK